MAIYTRRGDKGKTSLYDPLNARKITLDKSSPEISAIGGIDELNSYLGVVSALADKKLAKDLKEVQRNLFTIGSILAGAKLRYPSGKTKKLEKKIDEMEDKLPVLRGFILPGGSLLASHLQYARTLCRRAERNLVALSRLSTMSYPLLAYINRLSDYLFMLARKANFDAKVKEERWKRK